MISRPTGDWTPDRASPGLVMCQLAFLLQAALRGLSYVTGQSRPGAPGAVGWQWSPLLWGALLLGTAIGVVIASAARRRAAMELGHLLLAGLYAGLGGLLLTAAVRSPALLTLGGLVGALGLWLLLSRRPAGAARTVGAPAALVIALLAVAASLGHDYQVGTGLTLSAAAHLGIAWGLSWHAARETIAEEVRA